MEDYGAMIRSVFEMGSVRDAATPSPPSISVDWN